MYYHISQIKERKHFDELPPVEEPAQLFLDVRGFIAGVCGRILSKMLSIKVLSNVIAELRQFWHEVLKIACGRGNSLHLGFRVKVSR